MSRFYFKIENVGFEPLLCVPNAACCLNTSFSATPAGIEPAPPERQSGVLAVILWSYIFFLFPRIEKAACFSDKRRFSINHCDLSGYHMALREPFGPRHPLDPVLLRHTQISHSAFLAAGIIVPWRSNWRYVFSILSVCICSIALPFRTCSPFFLRLI